MDQMKRIARSSFFNRFMVGVIISAAILVGLETYPSMLASYGGLLHFLDKIILALFAAELLIKLGATYPRLSDYFRDPWNVFDFIIVVVCFIPIDSQFVAVLRLVRILRVLKLITAIPRLQMIVGALLKSIPSIGYIGLLLGLYFYISAVMATTFFGSNDPLRFGNLQTSFVTLFQVVTMEGWAEIMQIQVLGCDKIGYEEAFRDLCMQPQRFPILAPAFFILFIIVGTMIILNLFIGVIMKGMEEMQEEMASFARKNADASHDNSLAQISPGEIHKLLEDLERTKTQLALLVKQRSS